MDTASYVAVVTVRTRSGVIFVSMLLVCSGKFVDEDRWANASHSESASSCGLGGLFALPFAALIILHTSAELMLLLQSMILWLQDWFLTWVHSCVYYLYAVCTYSRFVGDVCRLYALSLEL